MKPRYETIRGNMMLVLDVVLTPVWFEDWYCYFRRRSGIGWYWYCYVRMRSGIGCWGQRGKEVQLISSMWV